MAQLEVSFEQIKDKIGQQIQTEKELLAAKEICSEWIFSKRKLSQVKNRDQLFNLLKYRGIFGPHKINTLRLFQKLLDQDRIYELVGEHEKLFLSVGEPELINKYAIERRKRNQEAQEAQEKIQKEAVNTKASLQHIPENKRLDVIKVINKKLGSREVSTFSRFLQIGDQDLQDIQRRHSQLSIQTTAILNCFFRQSSSAQILFSALKQLKRNDLIKSVQEILQ